MGQRWWQLQQPHWGREWEIRGSGGEGGGGRGEGGNNTA